MSDEKTTTEEATKPLTATEYIEGARLDVFGQMAEILVSVAGATDPKGGSVPEFITGERRRVLDALEVLFMPPAKSIGDEIVERVTAVALTVLASPEARAGVMEMIERITERTGHSHHPAAPHMAVVPETEAEAKELTDEMLEKSLRIMQDEAIRRANAKVNAAAIAP